MVTKTDHKDCIAIPEKAKTRKQQKFSVYLAGDLWTHKDLIGNMLLAEYIKKVSRGRYYCILPQDLEEPVHRTVDIRNMDLKGVMQADMAIFNFDGTNLDSGTVVEFMYAKMLDVPSVLLRTDFRAAGEGNEADQDPWNLMASNYPRTTVLTLHGMAQYQQGKSAGSGTAASTIKAMYTKMAEQVIASLDETRKQEPLASPEQHELLFDWALEFPGSGYRTWFKENEVEELVRAKVRKGLLNA